MPGSITKRGAGTWLVRLTLGTDGRGKRHVLTRTIHGTKKEAEAWLREQIYQKEMGALPLAGSERFDRVVASWWDHTRSRLRPTTQHQYRRIVDKFLLPALAGKKMTAITPAVVEAVILTIQAEHGPRSAQYAKSVLHQILTKAVREGSLARNPLDGWRLRRPASPEIRVLDAVQRQRFAQHALQTPWAGPLLLLLLATGLRPSEAQGLYWTDWDATRNTIFVRYAAERVNGIWIRRDPKTPHARRQVPLPDWMVPVLDAHRAFLHTKPWGVTCPWMFPSRRGLPLNLVNWKAWHWAAFKEAAQLPADFRIYDLRHTHATMLLEAGVHPRVVAERLGHASVNITLNTYSHVLPHLQQAAVEALNQAIMLENPASL